MTPPIDDPIAAQLAAARRKQILDAATHVFAEKGFHGSTVRDVAQAAGIADGTIYIYFKGKSDLMLGILDRLNETEVRDLDLGQATSGEVDFEMFMRTYVRQRFAVFDTMGFDVFRVILSELLVNAELRAQYHAQVIEPTYALAEAHFARWREQGWVQSDEIPLLMRCLSGVVMGMLMLRMIGDPTLESGWERMPDVVTAFILYGLWGKRS